MISMKDESTENIILTKAIGLFAAKGYEAIGVQEICDVSEITKPTLYYYFGSKSGLFSKIAETKGRELTDLIRNALEYKHDFIFSTTKVLKDEIDFALKNKDFFRIHVNISNSPEGSEAKIIYKEVLGKISKLFEDFFTLSANEFGNMRGKEKLYSILFHGNILSVISNVLNNSIKVTDETIYQIIHRFVYGVAS